MDRKTLLLVCALLLTPSAAAAGEHTDDVVGTTLGSNFLLDPRFGDQGSVVDNFGDPAVVTYAPVRLVGDSQGHWLLGYNVDIAGNEANIAIVRLQPDGQVDPAFGSGGHLLAPVHLALVTDVVRGDDGHFYASGLSRVDNAEPQVTIACVDASGASCAGFGAGAGAPTVLSGFDGRATRLLYRDGSLYVIGMALVDAASSSDAVAVAKIAAATGALDGSFGNGSVPGMSVFDIGFYPSGATTADVAIFDGAGARVLIAGSAQTLANASTAGYVLAFDSMSGSVDSGFGDAGVASLALTLGASIDRVVATALAVWPDGRIAVAGDVEYDDNASNLIREVMLAALEADGTRVGDFAGGGLTHFAVGHQTRVRDVALRSNGALVVAMQSLGLAPDDVAEWPEQSLAEFTVDGNGPVATVSLQFEAYFGQTGAWPCGVYIDADNRAVLAGAHFYGIFGPLLTAGIEMTATRFVTDTILATGFDGS